MIFGLNRNNNSFESDRCRTLEYLHVSYLDMIRPIYIFLGEIRFHLFQNTLQRCSRCDKVAVWFGPSDGNDYCDDCVPRGCSCNVLDPYVTGTTVIDPPDESGAARVWTDYGDVIPEQSRDDQGRLEPCVEYLYRRHGF